MVPILLLSIIAITLIQPLMAMETISLSDDATVVKQRHDNDLLCADTKLGEECPVIDETVLHETLNSLLDAALQKETTLTIKIVELAEREHSKKIEPSSSPSSIQMSSAQLLIREHQKKEESSVNPSSIEVSSQLSYEDRELIEYFPHFLEKLGHKPLEVMIKGDHTNFQPATLPYDKAVQYWAQKIRQKAQPLLEKTKSKTLDASDDEERNVEADADTVRWETILKVCQDLALSGKNHPLWLTLMVDSLGEIFKEHSFSKIQLAVHLNVEESMVGWIRAYVQKLRVLQEKAAERYESCGEADIKSQLASNAASSSPLIASVVQSAKDGKIQLVNFLISSKANVNQANADGEAPLMFAVLSDNAALLSSLIKKGAAMDTQNKAGFTALHLAAGYGKHNAIRALLEAGCNTEISDYQQHFTPLFTAIYKRDPQAVKLLLKSRANPNATVNRIGSALMFAFTQYGLARSFFDFYSSGDEDEENIKDTPEGILLNQKVENTAKVIKNILKFGDNLQFNIQNEKGISLADIDKTYNICDNLKLKEDVKKLIHPDSENNAR